jgi:hypothetical protein
MATRDEKNAFSSIILIRAKQYNTDCLDAMVTYCEEVGLEMEVAATLVNEDLKAELEDAFADLNYIERTSKLKII